ncbi:MAG: putative transposase [Myxococcota bacterium]|jgi:putative transposase
MSDIRNGRQVVHFLSAYLVFITRYRRNALGQEALAIIEASCRKVCADFNTTLDEFNGEDDHVHLLVSYPPKVALSRLVNSLKGVSSRRVRAAQLPIDQVRLWGSSLWSPSYYAGSAGGAGSDGVRTFIENQRTPVN